jgi:hypothetical protein
MTGRDKGSAPTLGSLCPGTSTIVVGGVELTYRRLPSLYDPYGFWAGMAAVERAHAGLSAEAARSMAKKLDEAWSVK